jgi:two-component system sensor histidine kinase TtrS
LENLGKDIAFAMSINRHRNILENLELEKVSNYEETILAFVDIIEQRDAYTAGHTLRVAQYCRKISEALDISEQDVSKLEKAAILHDIGKVVTPDSILLKPGRLSALEYDLIKQHAVSGYKMLSKIAMYQDLADIIKHHHEHYDGSGYPDGIKADEISLSTHIMIVSDAFDAMTTNRIYKGRKTVEEALGEIQSLSGIHFHPLVVEAALQTLKNVDINDTSQLPHSDLEQKRFSYFFQDSLTTLHNETYLSVVINKELPNFECLNLLLLRDFTQYNRDHGWGGGNDLLIKIANKLQTDFPSAQIFRFHGDDFVILKQKHMDIDINALNKEFKQEHNVYFDLHHYDFRDFDSSKELLKSLA